MVEPIYPWKTPKEFFVRTNSVIFFMFDFLPRQMLLNKMQLLSRDMYHKKVPLSLKWVFLVPKYPMEELFVNMVRNMNPVTHKYLGRKHFVMTVVSTSALIILIESRKGKSMVQTRLRDFYMENFLEPITRPTEDFVLDQMTKTWLYCVTSRMAKS